MAKDNETLDNLKQNRNNPVKTEHEIVHQKPSSAEQTFKDIFDGPTEKGM